MLRQGINNVSSSEEFVIGNILNDSEGRVWKFVSAELRDACCFQSTICKRIYREMLDLKSKENPNSAMRLDIVLLCNKLPDLKQDIITIAGSSPTIFEFLPQHVNLIKKNHAAFVIREELSRVHATGDFNDLAGIKAKIESLIKEIEATAKPIPTVADDVDHYAAYLGKYAGKDLMGIKSGFSKLDEKLSGLQGLLVLGGIPGKGKTSLALQLALQVAEQNPEIPAIFYSLEMTKYELYNKMASCISKINSLRDHGDAYTINQILLKQEISAPSELLKDDIFKRVKIIDCNTAPISLNHMENQIRAFMDETKTGSAFIVVDHLQVFPVPKDFASHNAKERIDYLMHGLKSIQASLNATLLLISQKNRGTYKSVGDIGSFMGSAGIEYAVDAALLLESQGEKDEESQDWNRAGRPTSRRSGAESIDLVIAKNRWGPSPDRIDYSFDGSYSHFTEKGK